MDKAFAKNSGATWAPAAGQIGMVKRSFQGLSATSALFVTAKIKRFKICAAN
jgi:hypothetical protein